MAPKLSQTSWDARFMRVAREAASWSKDPKCRVGAVLVSQDKRRVSWGYNGLPADMPDEEYILEDPERKNRYMRHAEENAISNAGCDLTGWTLYVTKAPCLDCAITMHAHRIARAVYPVIEEDSKWTAQQHEAQAFLQRIGVDVWVIPNRSL